MAGVRFDVAQRQEQIDHDAALDLEQVGERGLGGDLLHRSAPCLTAARKRSLYCFE